MVLHIEETRGPIQLRLALKVVPLEISILKNGSSTRKKYIRENFFHVEKCLANLF